MALLKCSLVIPEFNDYLTHSGVGGEAFKQYYDQASCFELNDNQGINYLTDNSLLCIAYNLLSRGYPTTASLHLSTALLERHFPEIQPKQTVKEEREYRISFTPFLEQPLTYSDTTGYNVLLTHWNAACIPASTELGSAAYKTFSVLEDLRKVAFVQKTLLFGLFAQPGKGSLNVFIDAGDEDLAALIVDDLNDLLQALCVLAGKSLPRLLLSPQPVAADLLIGTSWGSVGNYRGLNIPWLYINAFPPLFENEGPDGSKLRRQDKTFLSAPRVSYPELGASVAGSEEDIPEFEFHDPGRKEALLYILNNVFRKVDFRPGQLAIINRALQNKDVIGLLPTGGGKSLCFQLCGLLQPGLTLVIDPINSLMKDQYDKLCDYYIGNSAFINSLNNIESEYEEDEGRNANDIILDHFIKGELLFLFISPERLLIDKFRKALGQCIQQQNHIHYCIIDEAHCVSEWGHDFRIPYLRLAENLRNFCSASGQSPTLFALTATASYDVLADVQREMNLQADSIISLPPEAINRKELSYQIIDLSAHKDVNDEYPKREFDLCGPKYAALGQLFQELPQTVANSSGRSVLLDEALRSSFYTAREGRYVNAGIIFCTTRSVKLPGGVVAMYDRLSEQYPFLKPGTYFSPTDSETVLESIIDARAHDSLKNQERFLNDEYNLMICTKGFGMGIDKPNLRYTVHYAFPSSVESFYQESGRAGRDRQKAVCSILYHPADEQTARDFLEKSFRGVEKEMTVLEELLTEVRYEPRFFLDQLEDHLRSKLNYGFRLKFYPENDPALIYINGAYVEDRSEEKAFGALRLANLSHNDKSVKNVPPEKLEKVVGIMREYFQKEVPDGRYKEWITRTKSDGIRTTLHKYAAGHQGEFTLHIGFSNDGVNELVKLLKPVWEKITPRVIKAGYGFAHTPEAFIDNLTYRYAVHLENEREKEAHKNNLPYYRARIADVIRSLPSLDPLTLETLTGMFYRMRLVNDTQRAIYRLIQVGIIDDYAMDYAGEQAVVFFRKKEESFYVQALKQYLRRYLGKNSISNYIRNHSHEELDAFLRPLKIITNFFQKEVKDKRFRGLSFMKELCELAIRKGEEEFKQSIVLYFTSKYAKPEYLPADLEEGKKENLSAVAKYLHFLSESPDGQGGEKDNTRHLMGACSRLRIGIGSRNHTLNLLNAFAWIALAEQRVLQTEQNKLQQILMEFREAITFFGKKDGWPETIGMLRLFHARMTNINPEAEALLTPEINLIIEQRMTILSKQLNHVLKPAIYGIA